MFARDLGVDIWSAIDAAATKPYGFMRFTPGPGVGGHCLPIDPSYLAWRVERQLGHRFRFVELANDVNRGMPEYVVGRVISLLNAEQRAVNGSRILVLGLAYKPGTSDWRESPAMTIAEQLLALGADVRAHDAHVPADARLGPADPARRLLDRRDRGRRPRRACASITPTCRTTTSPSTRASSSTPAGRLRGTGFRGRDALASGAVRAERGRCVRATPRSDRARCPRCTRARRTPARPRPSRRPAPDRRAASRARTRTRRSRRRESRRCCAARAREHVALALHERGPAEGERLGEDHREALEERRLGERERAGERVVARLVVDEAGDDDVVALREIASSASPSRTSTRSSAGWRSLYAMK